MPELEDLSEEHEKFIGEAEDGAKGELAAALSGAKKLQKILAVGFSEHHRFVEPFSIAERKGLSIVMTYVQPPEQRAVLTGLAGIASAYQSYGKDGAVDEPMIDSAVRKALAHAIIAIEASGAADGEIPDDLKAAHDHTPSKFDSPVADAIAAPYTLDAVQENAPAKSEGLLLDRTSEGEAQPPLESAGLTMHDAKAEPENDAPLGKPAGTDPL